MKKIFLFTCLLFTGVIWFHKTSAQTILTNMFDMAASRLCFTGISLTNAAAFNWKQADAANTFYYEIQRSTDSCHFAPVLLMQAKSNMRYQAGYQYTDLNLLPGLYYYRLRIETRDRKEMYSQSIAIRLTQANVSMPAISEHSNTNALSQN